MIKGFIGATVGAVLGSEAIKAVGNSGLASGIKNATQSLIGIGVLKHTADMFKWK